jgi:hypothetical protein
MRRCGTSAATLESVPLADSGSDFRKVAFQAARFSGEFTEPEKSYKPYANKPELPGALYKPYAQKLLPPGPRMSLTRACSGSGKVSCDKSP